MQESKLIALLRRLSRPELQRMEKVVASPIFNKHAEVGRLFQHLKAQYPDFEPGACTRAAIWQALYSGSEPDDLRLRHLMSLLLRLAETSLVLPAMQAAFDWKLQLVDAYAQRGLPKHFRGALREARTTLERGRHREPRDYYHAFQLGMTLEALPAGLPEAGGQLRDIHNNLDAFYISSKLRQACAMLSRRNLYQGDFEPEMLSEVLEHLQRRPYADPLIVLYRLALRTLMEPETHGHFEALKAALIHHDDEVSHDVAMEVHILARNYCIKRMNEGDSRYIRELFDLYQRALARGLLTDDRGHIQASAFKNIVSTGLKLDEFDAVETFIHARSPLLEPALRDEYLNFSLGKLHFERGHFRKVVRLLQRLSYEDLFIELDARILLVKTWYELQEFDLMEAGVQSTRKFLRRNKLIAYHQQNYLNILRLIEKLPAWQHQEARKQQALRRSIVQTEPLTEREWLLEKLA